MLTIDQTGRFINLEKKPERIVSLVPSMTELVVDMLGSKAIIGRTKFCIHPEEQIKQITKIGGTKNPRIESIIELKPDLILANKEENIKDHITQLEAHAPVYVSNVKTLTDNLDMIADLGQLFNNTDKAFQLIQRTEASLLEMKVKTKKTVAYLIWKEPYMVAGGDTYINAMIEGLGLNNIFKSDLRYPEKTVSELIQANPDYIFLSSEPYPFKENHISILESSGYTGKIILADGEFFSWYGSRILKKKKYIQEITKVLFE